MSIVEIILYIAIGVAVLAFAIKEIMDLVKVIKEKKNKTDNPEEKKEDNK